MTSDNYRRGRQSVTLIHAHLVFVTKYRKKIFTVEHIDAIAKICQGVAEKMNFQVIEINGEGDHVHLLVEYPPKLSVSQIVNALKGVSSRMLRKEFSLTPHVDHLWSPSYFAISCGGECSPEGGSPSVGNCRTRQGASIEQVKKYIENQEKPS